MNKKNTLLLFLCLFCLWAVAQEKKPVKIACVGNSITYGSRNLKISFRTVIRDCSPSFWVRGTMCVTSESAPA